MKQFNYLLIFAAAFLLFSCKKSDNTTSGNSNTGTSPNKDFYINLKLNGVQKQMTYNVTSIKNFSSPVYLCELTGNFATNHVAGLTAVLNDSSAFIVDKTYTQQIINIGSTASIQCTFTFKDEDNTVYTTAITDTKTSAVLKFTEMASDHYSGTFSGTLLKVDGKTPATYVAVTEGGFYVGRSL